MRNCPFPCGLWQEPQESETAGPAPVPENGPVAPGLAPGTAARPFSGIGDVGGGDVLGRADADLGPLGDVLSAPEIGEPRDDTGIDAGLVEAAVPRRAPSWVPPRTLVVPTAYWTPVMTSVVAPVLAAPWHVRQSSSSVGALRSRGPCAVWARWHPAQLSAVRVRHAAVRRCHVGSTIREGRNCGKEQPERGSCKQERPSPQLSSPPFSVDAGVWLMGRHSRRRDVCPASPPLLSLRSLSSSRPARDR